MRIFGCMMMGALLASCSTQTEAPIVSGYGTNYTLGAAASKQTAATPPTIQAATIEPAAGPNTVTQPYALPAQPAAEDLPPAPLHTTPTKATLPPASVLGDISLAPTGVKGWQTYDVQRGDTLYRLARQFNSNPNEILAANDLADASGIVTGKTLKIPSGIGRFGKVTEIDKPAPIAHTPPAIATIEPAAGVAETAQGPNGTRYSLTRRRIEAAKSISQPQPLLADAAQQSQPTVTPALHARAEGLIEPAAGPADTTTTTKTDEVTYITHQVQAGETVYRIARQYGASVIDIMSTNSFVQPQDLKAGTLIKVPTTPSSTASATPATTPDSSTSSAEDDKPAIMTKPAKPTATDDVKAELWRGKVDPAASRVKGYAWPVKGDVVNGFGQEGNGVRHNGIIIKAKPNTPILAAEKGVVLFADNSLKTYGNLVLVRHGDGTVTAYGHANQLLVKKGDGVKKGQVLALSGQTGNAPFPQVHFEVRRKARAVDPLSVLARQ